MEGFWQEFAQELLLKAIPVLVTVAIAIIVKLLTGAWTDFQAWKPELAYSVQEAAKFAVHAAEQVGLTGAIEQYAVDKRNYALEIAQKYLDAKGLKKIDAALLEAAIEKAVIEYFPKAK